MSTPFQIAEEHWGTDMPEWVSVLAKACESSTQSAVAKRIERSPAVVSQVLRNRYQGDMEIVEDLVNGALMAKTVECPEWGEIAMDQCQHWRKRSQKYSTVNPLEQRMFGVCASCPINLATKGNQNEQSN